MNILKSFNNQKRTFIIAEIGKNFIDTEESQSVEKYLENAINLVVKAKEAGADAVKFQTHHVEDEIINAKFNSPHFSAKGSDRYTWVSRNTISTPLSGFWKPLKSFCDSNDIIFMSTPMSRGAAMILKELDIQIWKIGSGDLLDFVLLDYISDFNLPVILSSGMSSLEEVNNSLNFLKERKVDVSLLHCVSKYPCPYEELNLNIIKSYRKLFQVPIGFSDHSITNEGTYVAVALGAKIIEKHFSLSRDSYGSDHKVSQTPTEFKEMVSRIRKIESNKEFTEEILTSKTAKKCLGDGKKEISESEAGFRPIFRKSLVAARDIKAGSIITKDMIFAMRPQKILQGLPSEKYEYVLGKKTLINVKRFDTLNEQNFL